MVCPPQGRGDVTTAIVKKRATERGTEVEDAFHAIYAIPACTSFARRQTGMLRNPLGVRCLDEQYDTHQHQGICR